MIVMVVMVGLVGIRMVVLVVVDGFMRIRRYDSERTIGRDPRRLVIR
jgi:hypothetical protein